MGKYPKRFVGCLLKKAEVRIVFIYQGCTGKLFFTGQGRANKLRAGAEKGSDSAGRGGAGAGNILRKSAD